MPKTEELFDRAIHLFRRVICSTPEGRVSQELGVEISSFLCEVGETPGIPTYVHILLDPKEWIAGYIEATSPGRVARIIEIKSLKELETIEYQGLISNTGKMFMKGSKNLKGSPTWWRPEGKERVK